MTRARMRPSRSRCARLLLAVALASPFAATAMPESVLALHDPAATGAPPGLTLRLHVFYGADPLPVKSYSKDWSGDYSPRKGDNLGIMSARAEVGVQAMRWEVAALRRREIFIRTNRDTTDMLRLYKTGTAAAAGTHFEVDASYQAVELTGVRLGKAWHWQAADGSQFAAGIAYSELEAHNVREGYASGALDALGAGKYRYRVAYDDAWDDKAYPFQTPGTPGAHGQALDFALAWKIAHGTRFSLLGNDLAGRMHWHDLPGTQARIGNGGTISTDSRGYINYLPALSGRNARRDTLQRLPERWAAGMEAPWDRFILYASIARQRGENLALLGGAWKHSANARIEANYDLRFGSYGLAWVWQNLRIALRSSARRLDDAHAYGIEAGLAWQF